MRVLGMSELVYSDPRPSTPEEAATRYQQILADLDAPVHLGRIVSIDYERKTDRYSATFIPAETKKLTLKVSNEVLEFLAQRIEAPGYWQGRFDGAALIDVFLIQP